MCPNLFKKMIYFPLNLLICQSPTCEYITPISWHAFLGPKAKGSFFISLLSSWITSKLFSNDVKSSSKIVPPFFSLGPSPVHSPYINHNDDLETHCVSYFLPSLTSYSGPHLIAPLIIIQMSYKAHHDVASDHICTFTPYLWLFFTLQRKTQICHAPAYRHFIHMFLSSWSIFSSSSLFLYLSASFTSGVRSFPMSGSYSWSLTPGYTVTK